MNMSLYPFLFEPIFEGTGSECLLGDFFQPANLSAAPSDCSTCWQLVDSESRQSCVSNGTMAGTTIRELVRLDSRGIVGSDHAPDVPFPLCFRVLEAVRQGPLCVYPEQDLVQGEKTYRRNHQFWYSLAHGGKADVAVGIPRTSTRLRVLQSVNTSALREHVSLFNPAHGDAFIVPSGCLHAVGAGSLLWQVREHADRPISFSGWGPADAVPEEETEVAISVTNFLDRQLKRIVREARPQAQTRRVPLLRLCPQFTVDQIQLCDHFVDRTDRSTFHIIAVMEGEVKIESVSGVEQVRQGQLACIPAALGEYRLVNSDVPANVLRVSRRR